MRSVKLSAALALIAMPLLAAPALAQPEWTESKFTRDGDQYVVKSATVGNTTRVKGHIVGKPVVFDLSIRGDRVRGQVNNSNVEFRRSEMKEYLASR